MTAPSLAATVPPVFQRETAAQLGEYMRRGLEPMAQRLGVDYHESFFCPPTTDEARVLDAYRCGLSLLMTFTYPNGWPTQPGKTRPGKPARKASKVVRESVLTEQGSNAISYMTQGYAREMADLWRRAASKSDDVAEAAMLLESAARSDALGETRRPALAGE